MSCSLKIQVYKLRRISDICFGTFKKMMEGGQFHHPSPLPFSLHGSDGPGFVWSVEAVKQLESMKISDFQSPCILKFWWPYHAISYL